MRPLKFYHLPPATESAAANMADDLLILERFPDPAAVRFRHYGWLRPAFTFGYSQEFNWARKQSGGASVELCRRATGGGGLVDHRNDWTYSLVLPTAHEYYRGAVNRVYQLVHTALAETLLALGWESKPADPASGARCDASRLPAICFQRAERADLVTTEAGKKVAGAALKRNRHGLLLQGSIDRSAAPTAFPWSRLPATFASRLMTTLHADAAAFESDFPASIPGPREEMRVRFASEGWNQRR